MTALVRRLARLLLVAALAAGTLVAAVVTGPAPAGAVTGADFQAGNIISDAVFYNPNTLDATGVQNFLNGLYRGCASGYTCVRDYRVSTPSKAAESGLCNGYQGAASETAAQILAKVAQSCGINPQALLVLIQKESGLLTDTTPDYTQITGFGCPDSTGCDAAYYGYFNQVYLAARQFKRYRLYPTQYNYVAGRNNFILYNPNTACGGSTVYIQSQATAGLYDYTPYQPNAAALNNLTGTGDGCSAYGNRNFWYLFNTWFGSTQGGAPTAPLLVTADSPVVYLVSGGVKYPLDNVATLQALPAALQQIQTVPSSALPTSTGPMLHRLVRDASGAIYFFDGGTLLHVPTCELVGDLGTACTNTVPLTPDLLAAFTRGPDMTNLLRGAGSDVVYLLSAGVKYPIDNVDTLFALPSALGPVRDLSPAALPATTGAMLHRLVHAPNGAISVFDGQQLLHVPTCAMVIDFGAPACEQTVPITAAIARMFTPGPNLTAVLTDGDGRRYLISGGTRHEVLDDASLGAALAPATAVSAPVVTQYALAKPVARDGVTVRDRQTGALQLISGGLSYPYAAGVFDLPAVKNTFPWAGDLDDEGLATIAGPTTLGGLATDGAGHPYVLTTAGRVAVSSPGDWGAPFTAWPGTALAAIPAAATPAGTPMVQGGTAAVFAVVGGAKHVIPSWPVALSMAPAASPQVLQLASSALDAVPTGLPVPRPGTLVKAPDDDAVYLVDGTGKRWHLDSFATAGSLGLSAFSPVDPAVLAGYAAQAGAVSPAFSCGGSTYLADGRAVHPVDSAHRAYYGVAFTAYDPLTCAALPLPPGTALTAPVYAKQSGDAVVYQLANGQRRQVTSWSALMRLTGNVVPPIVTFATGQLANVVQGAAIS